jgi:hypothetical protein
MPPGAVSDGGVDPVTGGFTSAAAGAVLGASASSPHGYNVAPLISAALGAMAANSHEQPYYPEPWLVDRSRAYGRNEDDLTR